MCLENQEFDLKRYLDWKIAICYHPMFMLVDEDRGEPVIGERIPPWGAMTVEDYLKRLERNLTAVEEDPRIHINYEWAVCAIENIAERFPKTFKRMKALYQKGRISFVGGEYALVHSNGQGSEAAYREFEIGTRIFAQLFDGDRIRVFAHQETHIFEQLPALLKMFGIEYMVVPSFPWAVDITASRGFQILGHESGLYIKKGSEFISVKSLSGKTIPLFIPTNVRQTSSESEIGKDMWGCPRLWIDFPDLEEYHNPQPYADPVILYDYLKAAYANRKSTAEGIIHTYYSYIEGIWAEEHLRFSRMAEEKLVFAEFLLNFTRMCGIHHAEPDFVSLWKKVLKYEDHDAAWIEVTDLRRKAIRHFQEVIEECDRLIGNLLPKAPGAFSLVNVLPAPRKSVVELSCPQIPQGMNLQRFCGRLFGKAEAERASVRTLTGKSVISESLPIEKLSSFCCDFYQVEFAENGLISQITTGKNQKLLDENADYLCGEIRGVQNLKWEKDLSAEPDRMGRQPRFLTGGCWIDNRKAEVHFYSGRLFTIMERIGKMGGIPFTERYFFFRDYPGIKVELEYDFNGESIGDMHLEETKLNVYIPTCSANIHHDVPFGIVPGHENEPIYASNWITTGNIGLINRGTVKHFVKGKTMAMTFAWGSEHWTNRIHFKSWMEKSETYDLRLYGHQKIEYDLTFMDHYSERHMTDAAADIALPLAVIEGTADASQVYDMDHSVPMAITSLTHDDSHYQIRGYRLTESDTASRPLLQIPVKIYE